MSSHILIRPSSPLPLGRNRTVCLSPNSEQLPPPHASRSQASQLGVEKEEASHFGDGNWWSVSFEGSGCHTRRIYVDCSCYQWFCWTIATQGSVGRLSISRRDYEARGRWLSDKNSHAHAHARRTRQRDRRMITLSQHSKTSSPTNPRKQFSNQEQITCLLGRTAKQVQISTNPTSSRTNGARDEERLAQPRETTPKRGIKP